MSGCDLVVKAKFDTISETTKDSFLFVDADTANSLSVMYSLESLYDTFSPLAFNSLPCTIPLSLGKASKVVFLLSSFLWDTWDSVRECVRAFQFSDSKSSTLEVYIYCGMSEVSHENLRPDFSPSNTTAYRFAKKDLEQVFQDMDLKENTPKTGKVFVNISYLPVLSIRSMMDGRMFLCSSGTDLFPAPVRCIDPESMHLFADGLPDNWKEKVAMNAAGVSTILASAGVVPGKAHFWSLGSSATYLAHVLSSFEQPEIEDNCEVSSAAVVLIDRTMDLVAPTSHSDSLLHRILSVLPQKEGQKDDIEIDISQTLKESIQAVGNENAKINSGRLLHKDSQKLFSSLAGMKHKDALVALRKELVDIINDEELPVNISSMMRGAVNIKQLQNFINVFKENPNLRLKYPTLLQYIEASLLTLQKSKEVYWDQLLSTEKVIQLNGLSENSDSIALQLADMLIHPIPGSHDYYTVDVVLKLAIFAYSLCGSELDEKSLWEDEAKLKDALAESIISRENRDVRIDWLGDDLKKRISDFNNGDIPDEEKKSILLGLKMEVLDKLEEQNIIEKLHSLKIYRNSLVDYNALLVKKGVTYQYKSQISQVLEHIFHADKPKLHDLQHIQGALSGLLRSGLGRFGLKSKPHPSNYPLLIIYFMGGITIPEIKEIIDITNDNDQQVIIMSNCLASSDSIYSHIFN